MSIILSKAKEFRDTSTTLGFNKNLSYSLDLLAKDLVCMRLKGYSLNAEIDLAADLVITRIKEGFTIITDFPKFVGVPEEVTPVLTKLGFTKEQVLAYRDLQDSDEDGLEQFIAVNKNSLSDVQVVQLYIANLLLLNFAIGKYDDRRLTEPFYTILMQIEETVQN